MVLNSLFNFLACRACHVTYRRQDTPFPMALTRCKICHKGYVPEILLSTTELPEELATIGNGVLIEAYGNDYQTKDIRLYILP